MGKAGRGKKQSKPAAAGEGGGGQSGFGPATLFHDVHPQNRINERFFLRMLEMLFETTLSLDEQQQVLDRSLLLLPNKLATTWKHLTRFQRTEARLLEAARKTPLKRVQPVSHDPDLYTACD